MMKVEKETDMIRKIDGRREALYVKMVDSITDYSFVLLNKDGIIEDWNKGAEKIKGYVKEEIIGKHFSIFYVPEDLENNVPEKIIDEATRKGKATREGWRVRKDGSVFWGHVTITALHDDDNNLVAFSKLTRDLTEKKLAEEKMLQYAHQLESQNRELEQFVYVASHDLQEPLRKIKTFNERILHIENLSDQGKEYFNRSIAAANRMQRLINDLLAYSRATHDPSHLEQVDFNMLLDEIIAMRKEAIDDSQAEFEIVKPLPIINAIPFQMGQLLDNIISNAIKYHKPGIKPKIKITGDLVSGEVLRMKGADVQRDYWHLIIEDNGIGFEQQYNERIFEIFQRLHGHSTQPGSGIGLAICKKIVNNHQGFIQASGIPDVGATFHVYLPA